jgi:hypothetical protein
VPLTIRSTAWRLTYVDWFNQCRLHGKIADDAGSTTPVERKARFRAEAGTRATLSGAQSPQPDQHGRRGPIEPTTEIDTQQPKQPTNPGRPTDDLAVLSTSSQTSMVSSCDTTSLLDSGCHGSGIDRSPTVGRGCEPEGGCTAVK